VSPHSTIRYFDAYVRFKQYEFQHFIYVPLGGAKNRARNSNRVARLLRELQIKFFHPLQITTTLLYDVDALFREIRI